MTIFRLEDYEVFLRALAECMALETFTAKMPRRIYSRWKNLLLFLGFVLALTALKLQRLQFIYDLPTVVLLMSLYLSLRKKCRPINTLYISCICFLCLDVSITAVTGIQVFCSEYWARWELIPLFLLFSQLLCLCLRRFVVVYIDCDLKAGNYLVLLLPMLPYAYIRFSAYAYNYEDLPLYGYMMVTLLLTILVTFVSVVGNRNYVFAQAELRRRLEVEALLREQHQQYLIKQETIRQLNGKYHELKHYIAAYAGLAEAGAARDCLLKLEADLNPLRSAFQTGNAMVDVVLFEKLCFCNANNIRLTPYIDARPLDFVENLDLCTLFANALDNAIEATLPLENLEKRDIHVKASCRGRLVIMNFSNYFAGERRREGDTLLSTKNTPGQHGFGLLNMKRALENYNGSLAYEIEGDRFTLHLLIPLPETEKPAAQ